MRWRIVSGLILSVLGSYIIFLGGLPYLLFIVISSLLVHYEMQKMISTEHLMIRSALGGLFLLMAFLTTQSEIGIRMWHTPFVIAVTLGIIAMAILELILKQILFQSNKVMASFRVTILSVFTMPFLCLLRSESLWPILFLAMVICSSDVLAFFGGRFFGKTPLSSLSPKKTVEGSFFGLLGGLLAAYPFQMTPLVVPLIWVTAVGAIILGQMGDLHESLTKRFYQVKDSSNLIPGHGGFYDRMDSFILSAPIVYFWIYVL